MTTARQKVVVTFVGPEVDIIEKLRESMSEPSYQSMIRTLVKTEHNDRFALPAYKRTSGVTRETNAEKMRRLLETPDEELTTALRSVLDEEFRVGPDDQIHIETSTDGVQRHIRIKTPSTGMDETAPLEYHLRKWMKEKRI